MVTAGITNGDGLTQSDSSKSGDHTDSSLLDSSPSTRFYVRRTRYGNVVSFDSERTPSINAALLTPRASQSESVGATSMHVTPPTVVDALVRAPAVENIQEDEENTATQDHISDVDADLTTEEVTATGGIPSAEVAEVKHVESEVEIIPTTEVGDDIPVIEGTFAQDPNDDAPLEDMVDVHDSYDAVLADGQDQDTQAENPELEVTSPAVKDISPTKTSKLVSR